MIRANRRRWRNTRDSLPARRHRRRTHRRDRKRGGTYYPISVDSQVARRGVRTRLLGALGAVTVTLVCAIFAVLSSLSTFGAMFALGVGLSSLGAAVALLLSARQEEQVHAFAAELSDESAVGKAPSAGHHTALAGTIAGSGRRAQGLLVESRPAMSHASPGMLSAVKPCCYRARAAGPHDHHCQEQTDGAV